MKLRKVLTIAAACCALTATFIVAQSMTPPQSITLPLPLTASTASNVNAVIDCRYQTSLPLQISFKHNAATTDAQTYVFARSLDGVTYDTNRLAKVILAANGTTGDTVYTNITTGGAAKIKFLYYTNAAASADCTNASLQYVLTKLLGY